ncbi:hypothetical protein [Sutterella sp.]|uniref:hypothetical protein n=1 Tax=Sutterella sp. TaxID=1981025 RepID=UPI0026DF4EE5|nr:hypothetical protein [Sutterella sp.]MDO5532540.1 hypothetical protein [Sutterella sp.]
MDIIRKSESAAEAEPEETEFDAEESRLDDDWLRTCLLTIVEGGEEITGIDVPPADIAALGIVFPTSAEEYRAFFRKHTLFDHVLGLMREMPNPWGFRIGRSGVDCAAAVTILTQPGNFEYFLAYVRVHKGGPRPNYGFVKVEVGFDEIVFRRHQIPQSWYSPVLRRFDIEEEISDEEIAFSDLKDGCDRVGDWFITPVDEHAGQIDRFTFDAEAPEERMMVLTHSQHLLSDLLVVRDCPAVTTGMGGRRKRAVELSFSLDGGSWRSMETSAEWSENTNAVLIPLDFDLHVDMDTLCSSVGIRFRCEALGIDAEFSLDGFADTLLRAYRAIPPWSTQPIL